MPRSKAPKQPRPLPESRPEPVIGPDGREQFTWDQLPIEAQLRYLHAEQWVAWAPDEKSIIASGDDPLAVHEAARLAGSPRALVEWVPPVTGAIWE
jgi:hypothetical protein